MIYTMKRNADYEFTSTYHQCPTSTNGDQKNGCGISFNILNCAARRLVDNEEPAFISR